MLNASYKLLAETARLEYGSASLDEKEEQLPPLERKLRKCGMKFEDIIDAFDAAAWWAAVKEEGPTEALLDQGDDLIFIVQYLNNKVRKQSAKMLAWISAAEKVAEYVGTFCRENS